MSTRPILVRTVWISIVVLAIVAALVSSFRPQAIPVSIGTVVRAPLAETLLDEGRTRIHDRYQISASVTAHAPRLEHHVGDRIAQGDELVRLEPVRSTVLDPRSRAEAEARRDQARAALRSSETQVEAAQADADLADSELNRLAELFERQIISRNDIDRAEAQSRRARAHLASARSSVEVARAALQAAEDVLTYSGAAGSGGADHLSVMSPIDGVVLSVQHESEGVVVAGTPLLMMGDPDSLEVEVDVLSRDAVRIRPGMRVLLERWGGEQELEARVRMVEPVGFTKVSALGVEEQRVLLICDITADPALWDSLGDGYRVEARFVLWEDDEVLQVPASALFRQAGQMSVFKVVDGVVTAQAVTLGHHGGLSVEVLGGLEEGEQVVLYPDETLDEGDAVVTR
jgi:HlyD family secretion protein